MLSQEPDSLNTATDKVRAMWKRKNPAGYTMRKIQNITISPISSAIEDALKDLPEDIREESKKNKRNNQNCSNNQGYCSRNSSMNQQNTSTYRQVNKGQGKKKNKSSANSEAITLCFCSK